MITMRSFSQVLGKEIVRCERRAGFLVDGVFMSYDELRQAMIDAESERRYVPTMRDVADYGGFKELIDGISGVISIQRGEPVSKCRYCGRTRKGDGCDGCGAPG